MRGFVNTPREEAAWWPCPGIDHGSLGGDHPRVQENRKSIRTSDERMMAYLRGWMNVGLIAEYQDDVIRTRGAPWDEYLLVAFGGLCLP
jgi:hypothetical protein